MARRDAAGKVWDWLTTHCILYRIMQAPRPRGAICESFPESESMITSTLETVPDRTIREHLGIVQGSTVRAKHIGRDFMAGLKNIVGGELKGYTELLSEARDEAYQRMIEQATAKGANAVINVRFSTSSVTQGASEILAYGSAVIVE
jgi:uncharacterized protein YbjQ (UPF0145 family)